MKHFLGKTLLVPATLLAATVVAQAHDYTYIEGGYVNVDNGSNDDSGLRLAGSASLTNNFSLIGEYADIDDFSQLSAGGLFHTPVSPEWEFVAGATFEHVDFGPGDDSGFGLRGGIHWHPSRSPLRLEPEIRVLDFDDTATSARLGAQYELVPHLDLAAALQGGDDDRVELGVRYRFGR